MTLFRLLLVALLIAAPAAARPLRVAERAAQPEPISLDRTGEVTITIRAAPVQSLVESIVTNGYYDFVTSGDIMQTVNVSLSGVSIREALDTICQLAGLEYVVRGRIVTLYGRGVACSYTHIYRLANADPARVVASLGPLVETGGGVAPEAPSALASLAGGRSGGPAAPSATPGIVVDPDGRQLIVTARPSAHRKIEAMLAVLDVPRRGGPLEYRTFELRYLGADLLLSALKFRLPGFNESQFLVLSSNTGSQQQQAGAGDASGGNGTQGGTSAGISSATAFSTPYAQTVGGSGTGTGSGSTGGSGSSGGSSGSGGSNSSTGSSQSGQSSVSASGTSNSRRVLIAETRDNLAFISGLLDELDRPLKQIFVEITLMKINKIDKSNYGTNLHGVAVRNGRILPFGDFLSNLSSSETNLQLKLGTIPPDQFTALFDYLKSNQLAEVMASPRLLVQEGQEARINITQQFPITETQVAQGIPTTKVTFTDVGTILKFTPTVFSDDTIRLDISPEVSNVVRTVTLPLNGEVPVKDSNIIHTTLNVPDGHTAIIGGLKASNSNRSFETQPLLSQIPLVGDLFKRKKNTIEGNDIVFTLTPRVVKDCDRVFHAPHMLPGPACPEPCAQARSDGAPVSPGRSEAAATIALPAPAVSTTSVPVKPPPPTARPAKPAVARVLIGKAPTAPLLSPQPPAAPARIAKKSARTPAKVPGMSDAIAKKLAALRSEPEPVHVRPATPATASPPVSKTPDPSWVIVSGLGAPASRPKLDPAPEAEDDGPPF